jgi:DNA repair exonuclease SbcCD ATPase subunit
MGKFVGVSVALFVVAVAFVVVTQGAEMAALVGAFRSEPLLHKIAWAVIVLVPLVMLPFAVWLWERLFRQHQATDALEDRLDGVRRDVKDLTKAQANAEADVKHLTRTDPEDAIAALQQRLGEAERFAQVQQSRHEMNGLEARVATLREQQQKLKDRLAPVLYTRRKIEQLFAELDGHQTDVDRSLAEVASGDDGTALDIRLTNLSEFLSQGSTRCDQIEQASKTIATLSAACAELRARLAPFMAAEDGIGSRVRQLSGDREVLAANLEALERTPEGPLADRVQKLVDEKKKLDDGILRLSLQFSTLGSLRRDVASLFSALERTLDTLTISHNGVGSNGTTANGAGINWSGVAAIDARVEELSEFAKKTEGQFDDIESRVFVFGDLKKRLDDIQSRLLPLESAESGVVKLIDELRQLRDDLVVRIRHVEGGEEGDLAARVKTFSEAKTELEDRVSTLADQCTKLATIRKDIAGLFDKLSTAVSTSAH